MKHKKFAMTQAEAENIVGSQFVWIKDTQMPEVECPHRVRLPGAVYSPQELAAIAVLTPIYGQEPEQCEECEQAQEAEEPDDEEEEEDEEEEDEEEAEPPPPKKRNKVKKREK